MQHLISLAMLATLATLAFSLPTQSNRSFKLNGRATPGQTLGYRNSDGFYDYAWGEAAAIRTFNKYNKPAAQAQKVQKRSTGAVELGNYDGDELYFGSITIGSELICSIISLVLMG